MYESDSGEVKRSLRGAGESLEDGLCELAFEEVVASHGNHLLFSRSPLNPSRPGCAGDRGTVAGVRVIDVVEEPNGLLHVMARSTGVSVGDRVPLRPDPRRRDRLLCTSAATAACLALLSRERLAVVSTEIVAGLAWIEVSAPAPALDLEALAARREPIEVIARSGTTMTVYIDGQAVKMATAPIASNTGAFLGAGVRAVSALEGGHETLEVTIPDPAGRRWWL